MAIDGGLGADGLVIDDDAGIVTKTGILTERTVTGLGMGDANEGVRYDAFESLLLNLGADVVSSKYDLSVTSLSTPAVINLGGGDDTVTVGDALFRIEANLTVNGGGQGSNGDRFVLVSALNTDVEVDGGQISATDMDGVIGTAGFEAIDLTLSNSPDVVTIVDTNTALTVNIRDGADQVTIATISHPTQVNLGADADNDLVVAGLVGSSLAVAGDASGGDRLTIDARSAVNPAMVSIGVGSGTETVVFAGAAPGEISGSSLIKANLLLGSGNDAVSIATGGGLTTTTLRINGGAGNDSLTATSLGGVTAFAGGADNDRVIVPIAGLPTADQFTGLRLDVEELTVDNSTNVTPVAWRLTDLSP